LRGDDLIAMGMKPVPKFGEILEAVETRQLEGALKDREQALDWLKSEYSQSKKG
jgi:tRNA nucleotidyltransferase/poly(A) polymerase